MECISDINAHGNVHSTIIAHDEVHSTMHMLKCIVQ